MKLHRHYLEKENNYINEVIGESHIIVFTISGCGWSGYAKILTLLATCRCACCRCWWFSMQSDDTPQGELANTIESVRLSNSLLTKSHSLGDPVHYSGSHGGMI